MANSVAQARAFGRERICVSGFRPNTFHITLLRRADYHRFAPTSSKASKRLFPSFLGP